MRLGVASALSLVLLFGSCAQPPPEATVRLDRPREAEFAADTAETPPSPTPPAAPSDQTLRLSGAINEVLGFSFAVSPKTDLPSPVVRLTGFEGAGGSTPALRLDAFRIHDVDTPPLPGWHVRSIPPRLRLKKTPDVLVPADAPKGGLREIIRAGQTCRLWIDLHIDKGTPPGHYTGAVELVAGDRRVGAVEIDLTVWPFVLPEEALFPAIAEIDHRAIIRQLPDGSSLPLDYWADSPRAGEVNAAILGTMRLLREHGLTPVLPNLAPKSAPDARGDMQIDWALFDAITGPLMDGRAFNDRIGLKACCLPFDGVLDVRGQGVGASAAADALLRRYVTRCVAHFKENGWFDRSYAVLPYRMFDSGAVEETSSLTQLLDSASAGEIRVASPLIPQNMEPYGWTGFRQASVGDHVDIWFPPAQFFDAATMTEEKDRGRDAWLSVDRPPYSGSIAVQAPQSFVRVLSWQTIVAQAAALHLGRVNGWPVGNGLSTDACVRSDANILIYPGTEFGLAMPVPSVRLKWLRSAMQDAAYVRLLHEQKLEHVALALGSALVSYLGSGAYRTHYADAKPIGWPASIEPFDIARNIMGDELARSVSGASAERDVERFSRSAAWQRLLRATRGVRLTEDGCRVRRMQSAGSADVDVSCTLSVFNDRRTPLAGEVLWNQAPAALEGDLSQRIEGLAPGASRKVILTGRTTASALAQAAKEQRFVLTTPDGQADTLADRLGFLVAQPAKTPIRIDGDLADWPTGATNVADKFRLISPGDPAQPDDRSPAAQTVAHVLRDDDNLYVAVRCRTPADVPSSLSQKRVRYEDLVPRGEELVELLLDPLNLGTRSPADLHHIVLQRSGSDFAEKGIELDPPVGGRATWPADADVAIRRGSGEWVAEVRIPLSSFGAGRPHGEIWGLNITRLDAANDEFSTWSGAVGNAYDPMTLGNLYLP